MGYDIMCYSLLEITHKDNSIAYIELANKGRNTFGAENEERWDAEEPRTKEQQIAFEDTCLEVDFIDSDKYQDYPILLYKDYSHKHNDGKDEDDGYKYYNKHNFLYPDIHYEKYNSLLDEKIKDNINGYSSYLNVNDENYTDNDKRFNIIEKGVLLTSKDDIFTIYKTIHKKWNP